MKRVCQELQRHIESGAEPLPDALRVHLGACAKCQRAWRLHQAYQRALQAAQSEPTPACELPWSRVQAQLAARAVSRRPLVWLRPALGWGVAIAVALVVGALWRPRDIQSPRDSMIAQEPAPALDALQRAASAPTNAGDPVAAEPTAPPTQIVAHATPYLRESTRLQPPAPETPHTDAHAIRQRDARTLAPPRVDAALRAPAADSAPEPPFKVASLPLTPFGVNDSATGVEYLPISYGSPSSYREGSSDEAVIGSF